MKTETLPGAQPKTDEEYKQEADRLLGEIRTMLEETKRIGAESRRIAEGNQRSREQLRELICGNK